ncbi:DUF5615 family PIN-like protein [Aeoliella sp. ICT_H6.2]|uniref:DUF5615 family PIN-like protein n=1 Tax=Aeoliella straminimaris TaxID=2954799 RepID=A0A9X2JJJ3_9BACT|nr:DUF5615 family PIN-like protein [Aeoliella straminimaris]MCO6046798.1 DUF5615 family PIN-like protein [Aeoliella straminimaris]
MKLLLDQGLPRSAKWHLETAGFDAIHVGELGMSTATDEQILDFAVESDRVVVTLDADFHSLLAERSAQAPSVIRIRIEGLKGPEAAITILKVLTVASDELETGAAVSVTTSNVRVRLLPFGGRPNQPK